MEGMWKHCSNPPIPCSWWSQCSQINSSYASFQISWWIWRGKNHVYPTLKEEQTIPREWRTYCSCHDDVCVLIVTWQHSDASVWGPVKGNICFQMCSTDVGEMQLDVETFSMSICYFSNVTLRVRFILIIHLPRSATYVLLIRRTHWLDCLCDIITIVHLVMSINEMFGILGVACLSVAQTQNAQ